VTFDNISRATAEVLVEVFKQAKLTEEAKQAQPLEQVQCKAVQQDMPVLGAQQPLDFTQDEPRGIAHTKNFTLANLPKEVTAVIGEIFARPDRPKHLLYLTIEGLVFGLSQLPPLRIGFMQQLYFPHKHFVQYGDLHLNPKFSASLNKEQAAQFCAEFIQFLVKSHIHSFAVWGDSIAAPFSLIEEQLKLRLPDLVFKPSHNKNLLRVKFSLAEQHHAAHADKRKHPESQLTEAALQKHHSDTQAKRQSSLFQPAGAPNPGATDKGSSANDAAAKPQPGTMG
jgi:hypothetical protein